MRKELHEGEIWRKPGPMDWCKIERNDTPEAPDYDGGISGFAVRFGNFSNKTKRVHWRAMGFFIPARKYAEFAKEMENDWRYLMIGKMSEQKNELGIKKGEQK